MVVKMRGKTVIYDLNVPDEKNINIGNGDDVQVRWHSGQLNVYASTDDTVIEIGYSGSTQKSFDVKIYGQAATGADQVLWDASASKLAFVGAAEVELGRHTRVIQWKGTSYSVLASDTGKIISTTSANAAVVYTLPALASGLNFTFFNVADQDMTIQQPTGSADQVVTFNDAAADSIAFGVSGRKIGAAVELVCDGKVWYAFPYYASVNTSGYGTYMTVGS